MERERIFYTEEFGLDSAGLLIIDYQSSGTGLPTPAKNRSQLCAARVSPQSTQARGKCGIKLWPLYATQLV